MDGRQPLLDVAKLQQGQGVEVRTPGRPPYLGLIEESMPQLNLVWVREVNTGDRKMLLIGESYLYLVEAESSTETTMSPVGHGEE